MSKLLIIVDMQKDFVDGSLGTKEAVQIVPNVVAKISGTKPGDRIICTRDTHTKDYLKTQEGQNLPVEHCIEGTDGWKVIPEVEEALDRLKAPDCYYQNKPTFGSIEMVQEIYQWFMEDRDAFSEIELVGLCTDICVVSNALLLKAYLPEVKITVDASCCAGVTPEKHRAALETMRSCQINVIGE